MKKHKLRALDFEIDILTNSIQNTISDDSFPTEVSLLTKTDLKQVTKKNGWSFNWKTELSDNAKEVWDEHRTDQCHTDKGDCSRLEGYGLQGEHLVHKH